MSQSATRQTVLQLYRSMQREANKFSSYNFREYSKRRIALGFRENKLATPDQTKDLIVQSQNDYEMLKRQATINSLYAHRKVVVE
ncbi:LYR motif-containing protein 4 [Heterostelium album PN500]|uniref:LYR motif-containing protein 4 n=1 Tax=Heterostelium pallidum (strain ATCC 26659 / Pp 5 / PN500) TaxID=670386 RepID=D3BEH1_HETP5|nr:LYR motif-containing protein 4 [Heterostelium album PN500]EFA80302.1 LYR motif-containing protein 4 [Heterostelium album PN500]|eukprot:XP_020432422.1 LYR motif-containing protein 4 [Heterostelium album PN500]